MSVGKDADILLRDVGTDDLAIFFEHQQDPVASQMAAFTAKDPSDWEAFEQHWTKILSDEAILKRTILVGGLVAGHIVGFERSGTPEVTYWIARKHWGQGIATQVLSRFLGVYAARPLYARVAQDNVGSLRVLEKCGFKICGEERGFANARGQEIDEFLLKLEAVDEIRSD